MAKVKIQILKNARNRSELVLYTALRDELYFIPYWLEHYRRLGVREFLVLDDHSEDGSLECLLSQPDCTVLQADHAWGDMLQGVKFSKLARNNVLRWAATNRWALVVDADEFLILPPAFRTLGDLTKTLDTHGVRCCRAVMIDFFPSSIDEMAGCAEAGPFELCPNFDALDITWPASAALPTFSTEGVRPRLLRRVCRATPSPPEWMAEYLHASIGKIPLAFWDETTTMRNAHHISVPQSEAVQLVLAHFKFYPGWTKKTDMALTSKAYWNASVEYRFLKAVQTTLSAVPLAGPKTRRFNNPRDLEEAGLLYSKYST